MIRDSVNVNEPEGAERRGEAGTTRSKHDGDSEASGGIRRTLGKDFGDSGVVLVEVGWLATLRLLVQIRGRAEYWRCINEGRQLYTACY